MNNGSLILVRATHCARSWGIAAFASKEDTREPLTAAFMSNPANKYQHMWQMYDRKWNTDTGPSFEELRELGGREPPLNQCIGVVISSLRLDNSTWKANFESLSSASDHGGGWRLSRTVSGDSWRTIHVEGSGRRRVLDSIMGRPTDIRHTSYGSDGTFLSDGSPNLSSIIFMYCPRLHPSAPRTLTEFICPDMNFDVLTYSAQSWFSFYLVLSHISHYYLGVLPELCNQELDDDRQKRGHIYNVNELIRLVVTSAFPRSARSLAESA